MAYRIVSLAEPSAAGAGLPLATLLQEPSLPVVPGFVIAGTGPIATDDAELVDALAEALSGIGSPREVAWQVQAPPEAPPLAPPTEVRAASVNAATLLRELASAAGDGGSIVVRAPRYAQVRGRAFSEDPREDRVDQGQVEAWRGDQPAKDAQAVIYRRDAQGDGIAVEQSEAGPALTTPQLARIFDYVDTAEERLGEPVRLEWAVGSDGVWVTDVASIATPLPWGIERDPPQAGDGWTRANAGEIFPKPMTPMTWSLTGAPLDAAFASMYGRPAWTEGRRFVALAKGHVYFNFGFLSALNVQRIGLPSREMELAVGGPGASEGFAIERRGLHLPSLIRNLPWALRRTGEQRRLPAAWLEIRGRTEAERDRLRALDPTSLEDEAVLRELQRSGDLLRELAHFLMNAQSAAFGTFALMSYLLKQWLGDDDDATAVVQGLPGIRTAEGNVQLWKLAQRAGDDPRTRALVESETPEGLLDALRGDTETRWLADTIDAFLLEYGHRSAGELELMEPRWSDEPALILRPFRQYVLQPRQRSADDLFERQVARRREAEERIRERLSRRWWDRVFPLRRLVVQSYVHWSQVYAPLRENPKFSLLGLMQEQRRLLFALAQRLIERGVLREPDDIFFLFEAELTRVIEQRDDTVLAGRMRSRVQRRRMQYAIWAELSPPPVLGESLRGSGEVVRGEPADEAPSRMTGVAASPGVAEGLAHVATSAEEGNRITAGQVLVAEFTDPGWTPIFPLAAAVVIDIGGRLSHGAIVAREFGIPAVVNVRNATRTIKNGQRLRVDGTKGVVEILDAGPAPD
ncbi:MAG: PEP-utilizing enzyme [Chloroflexi bacterium]|nr:PEP-utilizing enzyme [Chloroflexota bacterium]